MKSFKTILETYIVSKSPEFHKTRDVAETAHHKLKQHYGFNEEESASIGHYTRSGAHHFNNHLWDKHKGENSKYSRDEESAGKAAELNTHLNNHKAPYDIEVHSGTRLDPRNHMNDKGVVHHPAFLSGSLDKTMANSFAERNSGGDDRHVLQYTVPKGHPGAYAAHVAAGAHEREFILPAGTNLKHEHTETEEITEHKSPYTNMPHPKPRVFKFHTHHMTLVK